MHRKNRNSLFEFYGLSMAVVLYLFITWPAMAGTIPDARIFTDAWQNAGCLENAVIYSGYADVTDFGAAGDGETNDQPAVAAAIASLGGAPGIVYFPAGTYLIQSPISVPSGTILSGESPENTELRFDFVSHAIRINGGATGDWIALSASAAIHDDTITVADGSAFANGDYAIIQQTNDASWNITDTWAANSAGQIVKIIDVSGNMLTLETPLRHDYPLSRTPSIRKISPNLNSGVENLKLERLLAGDNTTRNNQYTIHFSYAAQGFVRDVHSHMAFGAHVAMDNSTQIEINRCYFEDAYEYDGGGSGYGVKLQARSGQCLIENNIFRKLRHSMLLQSGANGNVFGYNYSRDTESDSHPSWAGDITLHGNYAYANLFEGNIVEHIWIDDSHDGITGPLNTFFRNRAENCGFNMTDAGADSQNVAGNELFQGSTTAQIAVGDGYRFLGSGHFTYGNRTEAQGFQPAGTAGLPEVSCYLENAPAVMPVWWTLSTDLPVTGPEYDLATAKNIPARFRYFDLYADAASDGSNGGGDGGCFISTAAWGWFSNSSNSCRTKSTFCNSTQSRPNIGVFLAKRYVFRVKNRVVRFLPPRQYSIDFLRTTFSCPKRYR